MKSMLTGMLFLLAYALFTWVFFMYVLKPVLGFSFVRTPLLTTFYFLKITVALILLFRPVPGLLYAEVFTLGFLSLLVVFFFIGPFAYRHAVRITGEHARFLHPDLELLALDLRFLPSKLSDILFQQTVIAVLASMLFPIFPNYAVLTPIFAVLFMLGHIGLATKLPRSWGIYFMASALIAGGILPFLILEVTGGLYYAIAFHLLWYIMSGVLFREHEARVHHAFTKRTA